MRNKACILQITGIVIWTLVAFLLIGSLFRAVRERAQLEMKDRWVVITGCDSGIGLGTVEQLAAEGAERAAKAGAKQTLQFDIANEAAVQDAVNRIKDMTGGNLWALVHNAGMVQPGFVEYQFMETYRHVMDVNYFAVVDSPNHSSRCSSNRKDV